MHERNYGSRAEVQEQASLSDRFNKLQVEVQRFGYSSSFGEYFEIGFRLYTESPEKTLVLFLASSAQAVIEDALKNGKGVEFNSKGNPVVPNNWSFDRRERTLAQCKFVHTQLKTLRQPNSGPKLDQ